MKRQWKIGLFLVTAVLATVLFGVVHKAPTATAINPTTMSFQGKVVKADGTNVADGNYSFVFKLYSAQCTGQPCGDSPVWTETQATVPVTAGTFQVNLGSVCSFFTAATCNNNTPIDFSTVNSLFLGVTFNGDSAGEMLPRAQLQSVPYAFQADNAAKVGGLAVSQLVQLSPGSAQNGNISVTGSLATGSGTLSVSASGDETSAFTLLDGNSTTNGTSGITTSTSLVLTNATNFDVGNYVAVPDTTCTLTGTCYAKITAKAGNTLTITPALTWTSGKTVTEYHIPELGGTDLTQSLTNRYGRGYFISGVATGNGTTYYSEDGISSSLATYNILSGSPTTTINIGGANTTTLSLGGANTTNITLGTAGTTVNVAGSLNASGSVNAGSNALQGGSINVNSNAFAVNNAGAITASTGIATSGGYVQSGSTANTFTGLLQAGAGLKVTGTTTLAGLATPGILHNDATGLISSGKVALGGETTGNYLASLGTLTGLTANTSSGAGISPNLSVNYGSISGTAVQGGTQIICPSGTGNVSGTGNTITLGSASASCNSLTIVDSPSFAGPISAPTTTNTINGLVINSGAISGGTSYSGSGNISTTTGNINTTSGTLETAGVSRIDANGNLMNVGDVNSLGSTIFTAGGSSGGYAFRPTTNNSSVFQVQEANSTPLLTVDSTTVNLITNPGFELGTTGWAGHGGATIAQNTAKTNAYHGIASLMATTTSATSGAVTTSFTTPVTAGTYTLSFYLKNSAVSTIRAGYNQGASDVACTLNSTASITTGFSRYFCTISPTATVTSIFVDSGATGNTMYLDAVQLQTGTTATGYQIGAIQLRGIITNPLSLQSASNSTTALQVQNAAGSATVFAIDTVNGRANVSSAFAVNGTVGATVATACTANQYLGAAKLTGGILTAGACTNDATGVSDIRLKTNINQIDSTLDNVAQIKTYTFNYKCDDPEYVSLSLPCDLQTGVIAQQLQPLFPNLVSQRDDGYYQVDYRGLSVVTLNALAELTNELKANGTLSGEHSSATGLSDNTSINFSDNTGVNITGKDTAGVGLRIDNADTTKALSAAIQVDNSGGAGYTNIISTPTFTVSGTGDVTASSVSAGTVTAKNVLQIPAADGSTAISFGADGNGTLKGDLNVANASLSGGMTIAGDVTVGGLSTFQKLATFIGKTVFRQDVEFDGHITVAKDSAGYADLRATEKTIHVVFKDEYTTAPVVSANIINGTFASYTIDHVDTKGFDITLASPALADTNFNWTAVAVNDPQTATNPLPKNP